MLYKILHRRAAFRHVLGQPHVPFPDLARQRSGCKIVLDHPKDRENRLVRIDRSKLAERNPIPNGLRKPLRSSAPLLLGEDLFGGTKCRIRCRDAAIHRRVQK
jgi:hypothetical protein